MAALNSTGMREHAHEYLEELRQSKIDLGLHPGSRLPAYCTAIGKLLLAYLPENEQGELITEMKLTKQGPNTITSKKALLTELGERDHRGVRREADGGDDLTSLVAHGRGDRVQFGRELLVVDGKALGLDLVELA
jgi:Bacterial transcriptional regulator